MNVSRLKLITFDVTNTLLKFRTAPGKQYGEIGALYGVLGDNNRLAANFKTQWHKMNKEHPNFGLNSGFPWQTWWKMIIKGTFADTNFDLDASKLETISAHLIELYKTSSCWQPCFGAVDFLTYLRGKNVPLGVISNFDPRLCTTLENTKLRDYFKFVLTSYEVGVQKPDPKIFEEAMKASEVKGLRPDECLHIGDRAMIDYIGALDSDWHTILVNDRRPEEIKARHPHVDLKYFFPNLYEVQKYFVENSGDGRA